MAKEYPNEMIIDDIRFKKSPNELYIELPAETTKTDMDNFLKEKRGVIEWQSELKDRRSLALRKFNKFAIRSKWAIRAKERKESIDQIIAEIESDSRVQIAAPVYFREDLKSPTGFTFDDQIIVRFDGKTVPRELPALLRELRVEKVEGPKGELGKGMMLLHLLDRKKQNVYEIAQKIAKAKSIRSARVNMIQLHSAIWAVPNDTYFPNQWNLRNTGQTMSDGNVGTVGCDINVEPAWNISKGSPLVVIAILDTGCDLGHPDLQPHLVQPDRRYNAETGTNSPDDDDGHGTNCAGIAAALTNSLKPQGVAGVGWHCRIMPIRMIFNAGSATTAEAGILNALYWALTHNADVISMSWRWTGGTTNINANLQACFNAGIVLVAASGNDAPMHPDTISYPASNSNVIAVGATNENDRRCRGGLNQDWPSALQGSQYGPELSVVAPGVHTWSTDIRGTGQGYNSALGGGDTAGDYFEDFGGTSGATPHVAGLAGLLLAYNPTLTPAQIRSIIENTADDLVGDPAEDVAGWDKYMGHGRINAHAALIDAQTNHPFNPADVYIRDSLSDSGAEPYIGYPLCWSPDIIVRKSQVLNPQTAFADMTVDPGSDNVEIGNDNYIYIRVHNKGTINSNIHVRVYYAPLTTTCSPDQWQYIGQIDFYDVPAGNHAVSDALVWEKAPDPGTVDHFCLIASIEGFRDPHPDPTGISNPTQYMDFIRNHNNISYRNVTFENVIPDTTFLMSFVIAGLPDMARFHLRIEREGLALHTKVGLRLPQNMFKDTRVRLDNMVERPESTLKDFRLLELKGDKRSDADLLALRPGQRSVVQLEVKVPPEAKPGEVYQIAVQQVFEGEVIGDFHVVAKVHDPKKTRYVAVRSGHYVHKANCKGLAKTDRHAWAPFESLEDARAAGYDMALDCLNQQFTAKNVSYRLARKVLNFVNNVELAQDLDQAIKKMGINTATKILEARDKTGRFTKLAEIEAIRGVGTDKLVDLVNAFKQ